MNSRQSQKTAKCWKLSEHLDQEVASHRLQSVQDSQASDGEKLAHELIEAVTIPLPPPAS